MVAGNSSQATTSTPAPARRAMAAASQPRPIRLSRASSSHDGFLVHQGLNKGAMTLIDSARADALYGVMGGAIEASGGSAANTIAGIGSLGGSGAFIGKVADDQLGAIFRHDTRAAGTGFATPPLSGGAPTPRCLIFVTPDAQRTMDTYLGACLE